MNDEPRSASEFIVPCLLWMEKRRWKDCSIGYWMQSAPCEQRRRTLKFLRELGLLQTFWGPMPHDHRVGITAAGMSLLASHQKELPT